MKQEFELLAKPLIKFINDNYHPHCIIVIDSMSAQIFSGEMVITTKEFLND